jgi:hypothetical protein
MKSTLAALGSVKVDGDLPPHWTFGGGASLALDLGHRVGYDIDALVDSARVIQSLVPVRNEVTRSTCWNDKTQRADFLYLGHCLKLISKGMGEIRFLHASPILEDATRPFDFDGRVILRERPAEIIAKKILHRGSSFEARDVFDLAGTYVALREELAEVSSSPFMTSDAFDRVRLRIENRHAAFEEEIDGEVNPTEFGRSYLGDACEIALEALVFMDGRRQPSV